jgi:hypothetical protein
LGVAQRATVTLAPAWGPGDPLANQPPHRAGEGGLIEFEMALDPHGHPDLQAWLEATSPWPARRLRPDVPEEQGDVVHDEEGWQLRFFAEAGADRDVPVHRIRNTLGGLRPGEVLTLRAPDGAETAWRVVDVRAAAP